MSILDDQLTARIRPILDAQGQVTTASVPSSDPQQAALADFAGAVEAGAPSKQYEHFTPESLEDSTSLFGSMSDPFAEAFDEGILGALFNPDATLADRERAQIRSMDYAEENPVSSFLSSMAGGLASDSPIDLGLVLATGGLGSAVIGASKIYSASKGMLVAARSVRALRAAYTTRRAGTFATRAAHRALYEFTVGATAAYISDRIQMEGDRFKNSDEVLNRMAMEGGASVLFAEGLRQVGRGAKKGLKAFKGDVNKLLPEDKKITDDKALTRGATDPAKDKAPEVPTEDAATPTPDKVKPDEGKVEDAVDEDGIEPSDKVLEEARAEAEEEVKLNSQVPDINAEDFEVEDIGSLDLNATLELKAEVEKQLDSEDLDVDDLDFLNMTLDAIDERAEELTALEKIEKSKPTTKAEPVKAEPVKAEPVKAEPVKAEPVKAEPEPEPKAKAEKINVKDSLKGDRKVQTIDAGDGKKLVLKKEGKTWVLDRAETTVKAEIDALGTTKPETIKNLQKAIDDGRVDFDAKPKPRKLTLEKPTVDKNGFTLDTEPKAQAPKMDTKGEAPKQEVPVKSEDPKTEAPPKSDKPDDATVLRNKEVEESQAKLAALAKKPETPAIREEAEALMQKINDLQGTTKNTDAKQSNADIYFENHEGKASTVRAIVEDVDRMTGGESVRSGILKRILSLDKTLMDLKVKFVDTVKGSEGLAIGKYFWADNEIQIKNRIDTRKAQSSAKMETLWHEVIHAGTISRLVNQIDSARGLDAPTIDTAKLLRDTKSPADIKNLLTDLDVDPRETIWDFVDLWDLARSEVPKGKNKANDAPWRDSMLEFIAYGNSDPALQKALADIPVQGRTEVSDLWTEFVKLTAKMLGLDKDSSNALRSLMGVTERTLKDDPTNFDVDVKNLGSEARTKGAVTLTPEERLAKAAEAKAKATAERAEREGLKAKAKARTRLMSEGIVKDAKNEEAGGFVHGLDSAVTKAGKRIQAVADRVGSFVSTDNRHLNSLLKGMGEAGRKLMVLNRRGINLVSGYKNSLRKNLDAVRAQVRVAQADLKKSHKVTLSVLDKGGENPTYKDVEYTLSGSDLLYLYMKSRDGRRPGDKKDKKTGTRNSLFNQKHGVRLNGKKVVLEENWVNRIADKKIGMPDTLTTLADDIWQFYRASGKTLNPRALQLVGKKNFFDPEHIYYSPSHVSSTDDVRSFMDVMRKASVGKDDGWDINIDGQLRKRSGGGIVEMGNPVEDVFRYYSSVPETLGMADFTNSFSTVVRNSDTRSLIKENYGEARLETFDNFNKLLTGNPSDVLGKHNKVTSALLSLRAIAFLGWNPSVAAKQAGSAWSAQATGRLAESGLTMVTRAVRYAKPGSTKRKAVVKEMSEHSPFFKDRHDSQIVDPDLADILDSLGLSTQAIAEMSSEEAKATLKAAGFNVGNILVKYIQKGMAGIRHMDEATMASIWQATKKQVEADRTDLEVGSKKYWAAVDALFSDIAIESQPTYNKTTRSINQLRRGVMAKALNQFTGQTAKNYGLAMRMITEYANVPNKTREDHVKFIKNMMPLVSQTAYITGVSTAVAGMTTMVAEEVFGANPNKRSRMQKSFDSFTGEQLAHFAKNIIGQIPGSGPLLSDGLMAFIGGPVYGMNIPLLNEISDIQKGISDRSLGRIAKGAATFVGAPRYAFKLAGQ